jgi:hypothetical protein
VQLLADLGDEWCLVVVAGEHGPAEYDVARSSDSSRSRVALLSAARQPSLAAAGAEL